MPLHWYNFFGKCPLINMYSSKFGHNKHLVRWLGPQEPMVPVLACLMLAVVFIWVYTNFPDRWHQLLLFTKLAHVAALHPILHSSVLDWAKRRLPSKWSSQLKTLSGGLQDFWQDGSLLCTLINSAIPGACPEPYKHLNKRPAHAQEVAFKYLGIKSVFTEETFCTSWSSLLQAQMLHYLLLIYHEISTLEKRPEESTSCFLARGMGLYTAEQYKEAEFFIYFSSQFFQGLLDVEVAILGPFSSNCRMSFRKHLKSSSRTPSDASCNSIKIRMEEQEERLRVVYVPQHCGIHAISLIWKQKSLLGSPYHVNVLNCSLIKFDNSKRGPSSSSMAISKYLKELTNSREKLGIQKGSYSGLQKMVDSSFRIACKVTRASPALRGSGLAQVSSSSPVCGPHIVPEDCRKLSLDDRRKEFHKEEHRSGSSSSNVTVNGKRKVALQRMILEKRMFWESAFDDGKRGSRAESRLKHVDSLYLLRKRPVSRSLSNFSCNVKPDLDNPRWVEENLDLCSKISLDERLKSYLANYVLKGLDEGRKGALMRN